MRRLLLAILAALVVCPASAEAYGPWEVGRAQAVAQKAFPVCARVTIVQETPETYAASYSAGIPLDEMFAFVDPNEFCTVHLTPTLRPDPWETVCTVMLHEYGHLAGLPHSDVPGSLMEPYITHIDPRCINRGRIFLLHG